MVHINDISATELPEKAILKYKKGDEIEVAVLSVDVQRERVALSLRALQDDFLQDYIDAHSKGAVVTGTVSEISDKQVIANLTDKVRGVVLLSDFELKDDKPEVAVGDSIKAKILRVDRKHFVIKMSVKEREKEEEALAVKRYSNVKSASAPIREFAGKFLSFFKKKKS